MGDMENDDGPGVGDRVRLVTAPRAPGHDEGVVRQALCGGLLGIEFDSEPGRVYQFYLASDVMVTEPAPEPAGPGMESRRPAAAPTAGAGRYGRVLSAFFGGTWAIQPEKWEAMAELLAFRAAGGRLTHEEVGARVGPPRTPASAPAGSAVGVLNLFGVMAQRANLMTESSGGTSTERFGAAFDEMIANPMVGHVVLNVDSPGGEVYGVQELAQKIYQARRKKPITAVANSLMASGAYWVASAADEIVVTPGGQVGSVGVFTTHADVSKAAEQEGVRYTIVQAGRYKTEGHPYGPLDEEAVSHLQKTVDAIYERFVGTLARNRNTTPARVKKDYGEGRVLLAEEAVAAGMADRVGTLEQVIREAVSRRPARADAAAAAEDAAPEPVTRTARPVSILRRRVDLMRREG